MSQRLVSTLTPNWGGVFYQQKVMRKNKHIVFCNSNIPWGGGEAWHLNAARAFAARGWQVSLLCHPDGELYKRVLEFPELTLLPLRLSRLSFLNPLLRMRLFRLFRQERPDAVIMNLPADLKIAGPAAKKAGVRHIVYRRGSALPVRDSAMNRHLYGRVITRLLTNSRATKEQVLVNNPGLIEENRISVIPNGVDLAAFDAALARAGQHAARKDAAGPLVIGNAGRLNRQKAQHLLLHIGKKLLDAGVDCRILVAGEGERGQELRELARELQVEKKVVFCGFMKDLSSFWRDIDVFVLTSLWEGFGNVIIEAGLAQKPVFAFAVSNLPELVHEGPDGNGRLFALPEGLEYAALRSRGYSAESMTGSGGDRVAVWDGVLSAMAEALCDLAGAPEARAAMGKNGRKMALAYAQERCMDALESLLL